MGKVYDVFDKFSIISIAIGFILGLYLAVNHNDSFMAEVNSVHSCIFSYHDIAAIDFFGGR